MAKFATKSSHGRFYAAGFNAFGQLCHNTSEDIRTFRALKIKAAEKNDILFVGWSCTVILTIVANTTSNTIMSKGHVNFNIQVDGLDTFSHAFGDHNGCVGGLNRAGNLILLDEHGFKPPPPGSGERRARPRFSHIARAGNERIAAVMRSDDSLMCSVLEFGCLASCLEWLDLPTPLERYDSIVAHEIDGTARQLVAGAAGFALLLESGEVYTWGDPRHQSLGRSITGEGAVPATQPGLVNALGGLVVRKIAAGGWITAALSNDDALYLWGTSAPGSPDVLSDLKRPKEEDVTLVEVTKSDHEVLDVLDVSVGGNHVALVAEGGLLFVAGENVNGQLGLGKEDSFVTAWTMHETLSEIQGVFCGPKCTFVW